MPNFVSKMVVKPPDAKALKRMNRKLREHHLYIMNKDILDLPSLLKEGITISKD